LTEYFASQKGRMTPTKKKVFDEKLFFPEGAKIFAEHDNPTTFSNNFLKNSSEAINKRPA
jgi:hypothetical protein